jgi:hypothetical protein
LYAIDNEPKLTISSPFKSVTRLCHKDLCSSTRKLTFFLNVYNDYVLFIIIKISLGLDN